MVDFVVTVVTAALMVLAVKVLTTLMDIPRAGISLWIGMCAAVSAVGFMAITKPLLVIGPFVGFPLLAAAIAATAAPMATAGES